MFKFIVLFFLIVHSQTAKLPKNFKKCNRAKTDFNTCLTEAVQNAVPQMSRFYKEIDMPSLAPLEVTEINFDIKQNKVVYSQKLRNCKLFGFENFHLKFFNLDLVNKILQLEWLNPEILSQCDYEISGKIILLPIQGQGNASLLTKNFRPHINTSFSEKIKNSNTYLHFDNSTIDASVDDIHFQLNNLFNGDKALGEGMNNFLNENWREIFEEVKLDYLKFLSELYLNIMNRVFSKLSLEDAFDD